MKKINGFAKLKLAILVILILMITTIIGATITVTMEENDAVDAYESLSYDDQLAVGRFSDKLTSYTNIYTIIGFITYAVVGGLLVLLVKLWSLKKL